MAIRPPPSSTSRASRSPTERARGSTSPSALEPLGARRPDLLGRAGDAVKARLDISRPSGGYAFRLRFPLRIEGPCMRCLDAGERRGGGRRPRGGPGRHRRRGAAQPLRRRRRARPRPLGPRRRRPRAPRPASSAAPTAPASARSAASPSTTPTPPPTNTRRAATPAGPSSKSWSWSRGGTGCPSQRRTFSGAAITDSSTLFPKKLSWEGTRSSPRLLFLKKLSVRATRPSAPP